MTYKRKTHDFWEVQQYTGKQYGWECVCGSYSFKEAREDCKTYRKEQPEYPCRVHLVRLPITPEENEAYKRFWEDYNQN